MSLSGIASSALSALQATSTVLDVISDNVSNVDTTGYVRRTTTLTTTSSGGTVTGVEVSDIDRTVSYYLDQETLTALGTSSQYETLSDLYEQIDALLGDVGDGTSITSQISDLTTALATASQTGDDSSIASVIDALDDIASTITSLYSSLTTLQESANDQVTTTVDSINSYIQQIAELNSQIQTENALGNDVSGLNDQRDQLVQSLAELVDVQTSTQSDGTMTVTTNDGTVLVGATTYAQLSYDGVVEDGDYSSIDVTYISTSTGRVTGTLSNFDSHVQSGTLAGLLEIRDVTISDLQTELGNLAATIANAYNEISNDYTAATPQATLTGTQTGLISTDTLGLSGTTTVAVTDTSGNLVYTLTIDFDNHTYTDSSGNSGSFGDSVGDLVDLLNNNSSSYVTADFSGGVLTLSTSSSYGLAVEDDATADTGISDFFGLNDLYECSIPTETATGVDGSDDAGLSGEVTFSYSLINEDGTTAQTYSVTIADATGMTFDDIMTALTNASSGVVTFTLEDDGSVTVSQSSNYSDCSLYINSDGSSRGDTGVSITQLFGIGTNTVASYAASFSVKSGLDEESFPMAETDLTSASIGDLVVGSGDTTGLTALEAVETASQSIDAAGNLSARTTSISSYSSSFYQDVATRASDAESTYETQSDRLDTAQSLQSSVEGVNLDEELANLVIYQQAYSAAARLLTTLQELYDTLLNAMS